ncbi:MAG TPA: hypothetical protein VFH92_03165 [Phenylobacterium sp.]|nr:hypothetical protein [Phenylobacterium sp.]
MTEADARLKLLFAEDEPTPRDPAFSAAVMQRLERRRLGLDMAWLGGVAVLGGLVLWALWPSLQPMLAAFGQGLAPVAASLAVALTLLALLEGRMATPFTAES